MFRFACLIAGICLALVSCSSPPPVSLTIRVATATNSLIPTAALPTETPVMPAGNALPQASPTPFGGIHLAPLQPSRVELLAGGLTLEEYPLKNAPDVNNADSIIPEGGTVDALWQVHRDLRLPYPDNTMGTAES